MRNYNVREYFLRAFFFVISSLIVSGYDVYLISVNIKNEKSNLHDNHFLLFRLR